MKSITRVIIAVILSVFALVSMTACSSTSTAQVSQNVADSQQVLKTLNTAQTIQLKKHVFALGDEWDVYADGSQVGYIKGAFVYVIGDTYSLFSNEGNLVASEGEQYRVINRSAALYDYNNVQTGHIDQEIFTLLMKLHAYDNSDNLQVSFEQKLTLGLGGNILNGEGEPVYTMSKKLISFGADISLERQDAADDDAMNAIWVSVIANEILEASRNSSNGK